tara:strand:- start:3732 stop:4604 length:873 start_codon:yes stop_codon:yes gene_type:complete
MLGAILGVASIATNLIGGSKAASAARQQADMQNQATDRQLEYDTEMWEMKKNQLADQRDFAVQEIETKARNEGRLASFQDARNIRSYSYDLQIRNRQQQTNEQQFRRSDDIFRNQLSLNSLSARAGRRDELNKLEETKAQAAFDANDKYVQSLITEGKMRARGQSGRSVDKATQAAAFDYGQKVEMLNLSIANAERNSRSVLDEIRRDRTAADLSAYAAKMLDPGILPYPIEPLPTPTSDFVLPTELQEYDFGPAPVAGAYASASAAANRVWGSTISSIAGSVGGMIGKF